MADYGTSYAAIHCVQSRWTRRTLGMPVLCVVVRRGNGRRFYAAVQATPHFTLISDQRKRDIPRAVRARV